jgi:signal recognition particle receptor subunit beta
MKVTKEKTQAQTVVDIFDIMGEAEARAFIGKNVHPIDHRWTPQQIQSFLESCAYGIHKSLPSYAEVAIEKFNDRG